MNCEKRKLVVLLTYRQCCTIDFSKAPASHSQVAVECLDSDWDKNQRDPMATDNPIYPNPCEWFVQIWLHLHLILSMDWWACEGERLDPNLLNFSITTYLLLKYSCLNLYLMILLRRKCCVPLSNYFVFCSITDDLTRLATFKLSQNWTYLLSLPVWDSILSVLSQQNQPLQHLNYMFLRLWYCLHNSIIYIEQKEKKMHTLT